jgi:TUP1-like enhancer of split
MSFAVLTLKGNVAVYKVRNAGETTGVSLIDACTLEWQASFTDVLRQRMAQPSLEPTKLSVRHMKLVSEASVLMFLSDGSVFEYEAKVRGWRQTLLNGNVLPEQLRGERPSQNA